MPSLLRPLLFINFSYIVAAGILGVDKDGYSEVWGTGSVGGRVVRRGGQRGRGKAAGVERKEGDQCPPPSIDPVPSIHVPHVGQARPRRPY